MYYKGLLRHRMRTYQGRGLPPPELVARCVLYVKGLVLRLLPKITYTQLVIAS